jgi:hypothetical protein
MEELTSSTKQGRCCKTGVLRGTGVMIERWANGFPKARLFVNLQQNNLKGFGSVFLAGCSTIAASARSESTDRLMNSPGLVRTTR